MIISNKNEKIKYGMFISIMDFSALSMNAWLKLVSATPKSLAGNHFFDSDWLIVYQIDHSSLVFLLSY